MQRNWIGRSEGATVRFDVPGAALAGASATSLDVYTTRPDNSSNLPSSAGMWDFTTTDCQTGVFALLILIFISFNCKIMSLILMLHSSQMRLVQSDVVRIVIIRYEVFPQCFLGQSPNIFSD